jgi:hypothetical protein
MDMRTMLAADSQNEGRLLEGIQLTEWWPCASETADETLGSIGSGFLYATLVGAGEGIL